MHFYIKYRVLMKLQEATSSVVKTGLVILLIMYSNKLLANKNAPETRSRKDFSYQIFPIIYYQITP